LCFWLAIRRPSSCLTYFNYNWIDWHILEHALQNVVTWCALCSLVQYSILNDWRFTKTINIIEHNNLDITTWSTHFNCRSLKNRKAVMNQIVDYQECRYTTCKNMKQLGLFNGLKQGNVTSTNDCHLCSEELPYLHVICLSVHC